MGRRKKIAIVCAAHGSETGCNSGMYSVDLAATHFFKDTCDYDLFVAQERKGYLAGVSDNRYNLYSDPTDLYGYDTVVYWGDFLTNPAYGLKDFSSRDIRWGLSENRGDAFLRWRKLFSLEGEKPPFEAVSIGTNYQLDLSSKKKAFNQSLRSIEENFSYIFPRDHFSVKNLSKHFSYSSLVKIIPALDCAFLLDPITTQKEPFFSYFFGRSGLSNVDDLVGSIESCTGLKGQKLKNWLRLPYDSSEAEFSVLRSQIAASQFVLTDTYHVSVNCFSLSTPVIGVGRKAAYQDRSVGDFKKRVLFDMVGHSDAYFEVPSNTDDANRLWPLIERMLVAEDYGSFLGRDRFLLARELTKKFKSDIKRCLGLADPLETEDGSLPR